MITINAEKMREIFNDRQRRARSDAFKAEYDPIAGKYARGEATQEELIAKADEIRARFPYQE